MWLLAAFGSIDEWWWKEAEGSVAAVVVDVDVACVWQAWEW
jgi:hypothetical protein